MYPMLLHLSNHIDYVNVSVSFDLQYCDDKVSDKSISLSDIVDDIYDELSDAS